MKRTFLFLVLYLSSLVGLAYYLALTRQSDRRFELETDRAWKGARLELCQQGIHCDGS
jgi:hypothetical protein